MPRGSLPAAPAKVPGLPTNTELFSFEGFDGLNTKPTRMAIGDREMYYVNNFMPLGSNNLRALPDVGAAIYSVPQPPAPPIPPPAGGPQSAYWRLYITAVDSRGAGGGNAVSIARLEMYATLGGANLCSGGTASSSANSVSPFSDASYAFDGDPNTAWSSPTNAEGGTLPQWIQYQFATAVSVNVVGLQAIYYDGDANAWYPEFMPADFLLQYSPDGGSTWVTHGTFAHAFGWQFSAFYPTTLRYFDATYSPVWYRVNTSQTRGVPPGGWPRITTWRMQLHNQADLSADLCVNGGSSASSNTGFYYSSFCAFAFGPGSRGVYNGGWGGLEGASMPQWLSYGFWANPGAAVNALGLTMIDGLNTFQQPTTWPQNFTIETSPDFSSWTVLSTIVGASFSSLVESVFTW